MYSYYAVRAAGFRPPRLVNMSITALQIAQMDVGLVVQLAVASIKLGGGGGEPCRQSPTNAVFGTLMYLSYFALFVRFFFRAYAVRPGKPSAAAVRTAAVSVENGSTPAAPSKAFKTL